MTLTELEKKVIVLLKTVYRKEGGIRIGATTRFFWFELDIMPSDALNTLNRLEQEKLVYQIGRMGNQINWGLTKAGIIIARDL